ncbi:unnamed protein product [Chrysoparadoxa australica]
MQPSSPAHGNGDTGSHGETQSREGKVTVDQGIDLCGTGCFQRTALLICGIALLSEAAETTLLSFIGLCTQHKWDLSTGEVGLLLSGVFVGQFLGAIIFGVISDHYGRKRTFRIATTFIAVAGLLSAVAPSYMYLLVLRALVGVGIGGVFVPFDLLAEVVPTTSRGRYLSFADFFWTFGSIAMVLLAWATLEALGWRWLTAFSAVPAVISLLSLPFLPESPRWLMSRQPPREREALEALRSIAKANGRSLPDNLELIAESHAVSEMGLKNVVELFSPKIRGTTVFLWIVWFCYGVVYDGVVLLNGVEFEKSEAEENGVCSFEYLDMLIVSLSEVPATVALIMVIDTIGRRLSQALAYALCAILIIPVGVIYQSGPRTAFLFLARAMVAFGSGATLIAAPELYPTEIRGTGHAAAELLHKVGAFIVPFWVNSSFDYLHIVLGLAVCSAVAGVAALILPETMNVQMGHDLDMSATEDEVELTAWIGSGCCERLKWRGSIKHESLSGSGQQRRNNSDVDAGISPLTENMPQLL